MGDGEGNGKGMVEARRLLGRDTHDPRLWFVSISRIVFVLFVCSVRFFSFFFVSSSAVDVDGPR